MLAHLPGDVGARLALLIWAGSVYLAWLFIRP
jgi:hypothetical protein